MYASWNGATDVHSWRFHGGPSASGPFTEAAVTLKTEFETRARAPFFARYVYVEAVDDDGSILGRSKTVKTQIPPIIFLMDAASFVARTRLNGMILRTHVITVKAAFQWWHQANGH